MAKIYNKNEKTDDLNKGKPERFAIYYAPEPFSKFHALGSAWLGRDTQTGKVLSQPSIDRMTAKRFFKLTESARHYGFHATLKPPFRLKCGMKQNLLKQAIKEICENITPFSIQLDIHLLGKFFALMLPKKNPGIQKLAEAMVRDIDVFRGPSTSKEIKARREKGLSRKENQNLVTWGYPYVFSEFQFHMTLTDRIQSSEEQAIIYDALQSHFEDFLKKDITIEEVCLFHQINRQAPFTLVDRFKLSLG